MSLGRARVALVVSVLTVAFAFGCPRPPPVMPEVKLEPAAIRVPPGCEQDLSGVYAYEGRSGWRYQAVDDGGTLRLALEPGTADAGVAALAPGGDGGALAQGSGVSIALMRTPQGFVGGIEHTVFPAAGAACTVVFPTEVTACGDGGLTIASVETLDVDQSCQSPPADGGLARKTHRLVRIVAEAADAGAP